ncbi:MULTISPECIES: hypothetical protein [unclassified Streptomyces]|nr:MULTISPECIES: hypothetical protein [unclassified Streptomyces]
MDVRFPCQAHHAGAATRVRLGVADEYWVREVGIDLLLVRLVAWFH